MLLWSCKRARHIQRCCIKRLSMPTTFLPMVAVPCAPTSHPCDTLVSVERHVLDQRAPRRTTRCALTWMHACACLTPPPAYVCVLLACALLRLPAILILIMLLSCSPSQIKGNLFLARVLLLHRPDVWLMISSHKRSVSNFSRGASGSEQGCSVIKAAARTRTGQTTAMGADGSPINARGA